MSTESVFPASLDTVSPEELATTIGSVIMGTENAPIEKKTRQRRLSDGKAFVKLQSTEDFIKNMQEKIDMIRILDSITMGEIPGNMSKANRDIIVEFQREHDGLVKKFMERIQKA